MGRSSEAKDRKNHKKSSVMDGPTDGRTDRRTDGPTKRGEESRSTRLKRAPKIQMEKRHKEGRSEIKSEKKMERKKTV